MLMFHLQRNGEDVTDGGEWQQLYTDCAKMGEAWARMRSTLVRCTKHHSTPLNKHDVNQVKSYTHE